MNAGFAMEILDLFSFVHLCVICYGAAQTVE
jgi:hypothetical protein